MGGNLRIKKIYLCSGSFCGFMQLLCVSLFSLQSEDSIRLIFRFGIRKVRGHVLSRLLPQGLGFYHCVHRMFLSPKAGLSFQSSGRANAGPVLCKAVLRLWPFLLYWEPGDLAFSVFLFKSERGTYLIHVWEDWLSQGETVSSIFWMEGRVYGATGRSAQ